MTTAEFKMNDRVETPHGKGTIETLGRTRHLVRYDEPREMKAKRGLVKIESEAISVKALRHRAS